MQHDPMAPRRQVRPDHLRVLGRVGAGVVADDVDDPEVPERPPQVVQVTKEQRGTPPFLRPASVRMIRPVRQWILPARYRFWLLPGVSTAACSPRFIHWRPTFGLRFTSTSSMNTAVSSAGSRASNVRNARSFPPRSGSFGRMPDRGRRHTNPAARSHNRTVSRPTWTR